MSQTFRILYAEDDANDAFFMERAFAKSGLAANLHIVENGAAAVEYLSGDNGYGDRERFPLPKIILLDVKMPGVSGLEALQWVRARNEFDWLPVVMFTSSTQESDVAVAREFGANAYLVKPSNVQNLHELVTMILGAARSFASRDSILGIPGNVL